MLDRHPAVFLSVLSGLLVAMSVAGCQTFREVAQLRNVTFQIDRISDARLAGIELRRIQSYEDLGGLEVARLASQVSNGELPFSFTLHLEASNPAENSVDARLTEMDWTLLLQDRETITGSFEREVVMPSGESTEVPFEMSLNLLNFFDQNLRGLVELAAGFGGDRPPASVALEVQPTIQTPVGPIRYAEPITVTRREVGRSDSSGGGQ